MTIIDGLPSDFYSGDWWNQLTDMTTTWQTQREVSKRMARASFKLSAKIHRSAYKGPELPPLEDDFMIVRTHFFDDMDREVNKTLDDMKDYADRTPPCMIVRFFAWLMLRSIPRNWATT